MAGRDARLLFCAMSGIQPHAATPVATITEFPDDPCTGLSSDPEVVRWDLLDLDLKTDLNDLGRRHPEICRRQISVQMHGREQGLSPGGHAT